MEIDILKFQNFKAITDRTFVFGGRSAEIYGANETKKTTIFDGFTWLLFNKDSTGQTDFDVKPIDPVTEETIHGLTTIVEAVLFHEGERVILKKTLVENWVVPSGQTDALFSGNSSEYFVDDLKVQKTEYDSRITEFVDVQAFKLLTNPLYFNEQLKWEDRRKLLMEICGDVTSEEVEFANPELAGITDMLGGYSFDDFKTVVKSARVGLNKDLVKIPIRITEAQASIPDVYNIDFDATAFATEAQISISEALAAKLVDAKNGSLLGALKVELTELSHKALVRVNKIKGDIDKEKWAEKTTRAKASAEMKVIDNKMYAESMKIGDARKNNEYWNKEADAQRDKYAKRSLEEFVLVDIERCQTCGQMLPADKVLETRKKAEKKFNTTKSKDLERIKVLVTGTMTPKIEKNEAIIKVGEDRIHELGKDENTQCLLMAAADEKLKAIDKKLAVAEFDPECLKIEEQRKDVRARIASLENDNGDEIEDIKRRKELSDLEVNRLRTVFARKEQLQNAQARIKMHTEEGQKLAAEIEQIDEQLDLCDRFMEAKVSMLETLINSRFKMTKFKLFTKHIKGGHESCCEVTYKGVPYRSMNNAAKINSGFDLINLFSIHYDFTAPIFADNAEAVDDLLETNAQVFKLIVSKKDKKLRIEQGD